MTAPALPPHVANHPGTILTYTYHFVLPDRQQVVYPLYVDEQSFVSLVDETGAPEWARADEACSGKCGCTTPYCQVALRIAGPIKALGHLKSYDRVEAQVITPTRRYWKETDAQDAIRSLFGLVMATSGVPAMSFFSMMGRLHLPFATYDETLYRAMSSYLLMQYFEAQKGGTPDWTFEKMNGIYGKVSEINNMLVKRLRKAVEQDSSLNAIIFLECFAGMFPSAVTGGLKDLEKFLPKS